MEGYFSISAQLNIGYYEGYLSGLIDNLLFQVFLILGTNHGDYFSKILKILLVRSSMSNIMVIVFWISQRAEVDFDAHSYLKTQPT